MKINIQGEPEELDGIIPHGVMPLMGNRISANPSPANVSRGTLQPANAPLTSLPLPRIPAGMFGPLGEPTGVRPMAGVTPIGGRPGMPGIAPQMPQASPEQPQRSLISRIGHGLEETGKTAGEIAGSALIPHVMPYIPGTPQHAELVEQEAEQKRLAQAEEKQREAQAGLQTAEAIAEPTKEKAAEETAAAALYRAEHPQATEGQVEEGAIDDYLKAHPGSNKADALESIKRATQKPAAPKLYTDPATGKQFYGEPMGAGVTDTATGSVIPNAQPYEKPAAPNEFNMWLKEHPGETVDDYMRTLAQLRPEFPRMQPVTDAQGNTHGYVAFTGTAAGTTAKYIPVSEIQGFPQNLGGNVPGVIPPKPTSTTLTMAQMAGSVLPQAESTIQEVQSLSNEIGPTAGRWHDIYTNRVGAKDPKFAQLDTNLKLLASAIVRTHFGARGGQDYREALEKQFTSAQSPENLIARIQGAEQWLQGYAARGGEKLPAAAKSAASQGPKSGVVEDGWKFKGGDPGDRNNWEKVK